VFKNNPRVKNGDVTMFEQWQPWWDCVLLLVVSTPLFIYVLLDEESKW